MAQPQLLQDEFSGGMKPDVPITEMPKNAVRNMTDFVPWAGEAPLSARSGWDRVGASTGQSYVAALAFAPFASNPQLVSISNNGAVHQQEQTGSSATARGTAQVPSQPPVFYRNKLYIPTNVGNTPVYSYDGTTNVTAAAGSPPGGMIAAVYKDHLVLARDATSYQRIYFSNAGDAASWDTAADGQWLDVSYPVTGLAVVRNMMLAFAEEGVERIRGDIIPGVAGSDFVVEPLPAPGCADPASIVVANDVCYYTNATGIYMTDGIGSVDLSMQGGIKAWWNNLLGGYDSGWTIAGGVFSGKYIVSVHDGSEFKLCVVCDVGRRSFYQFSNVPAIMFASSAEGFASSTAGNLFMAERDAPFVANASTMFRRRSLADDVIGGDYADGNGGNRTARLRTGYFMGKPGRKRIKKIYLTYGADEGVTIECHAYTNPSLYSGSEIDIGDITGSIASMNVPIRQRLALSRAKEGTALEFHAALTGFTRMNLYKIEAEMLPGETSRG